MQKQSTQEFILLLANPILVLIYNRFCFSETR